MNKLDVVKFLLTEIEYEKELFKVCEADKKQAKEQAEKNNGEWYYKYLKYEGRQPSKARIKNNCKKIRQIMLDVIKEEIR